MATFEIKNNLVLTFDVSKANILKHNGTFTETFDLSDLTSDDVEQYLAQTLVIKRQGQIRSAKMDELGETKIKIGTWKVAKPGKRIATDPVTKVTEALNKLTYEQKLAIAKSMGFDFLPTGLALEEDSKDLEEAEEKTVEAE